jgi:hypothetical protein
MKATTQLQREVSKSTVTDIASKASLNPLQLKTEVENMPLQKKHNPLEAVTYTQNPLQLLSVQRAQPNSNNPLQLKKENKTGLPDDLKANVESLSGYNLDNVRVHYNSSKPAQVQALAYAQGNKIYVAPGQEKYLPHEVWHVVQQKQGRVRPTIQMKGEVGINDDETLEKEADIMGLKALRTTHSQSDDIIHKQELSANPYTDTSKVKQLFTYTKFLVHDRASGDVILDAIHNRIKHNSTQSLLAARLSGYDAITQAPRNCNHYVPYSKIASAIIEKIKIPPNTNTVDHAVSWMEGLDLQPEEEFDIYKVKGKKRSPSYSVTAGEVPEVDIPAINVGGGVTAYNESILDSELDDLIANIANDPRNLFYWPTSTGDSNGTAIDTPTGSGAIKLSDLNSRLEDYHNYLQNTLNLNVP